MLGEEEEPFIKLPTRSLSRRPLKRNVNGVFPCDTINDKGKDTTRQSHNKESFDHNDEDDYGKSWDRKENDDNTFKPFTPYDITKRLFHRAANVRIVGRTVERAAIETFWINALVREGSQSNHHQMEACPRVLYICGNPGTGKTALVQEMIPELMNSSSKKILLIKVNCMMKNDPREALELIAQKLKVTVPPCKGETKWVNLTRSIEEALFKLDDTITVMILDEVDQLAIKDNLLLETIFKWPYLPTVKMVIIGIANALDLSIKYVSSTTTSNQITILNFTPYSVEDISHILMARLELANQRISGDKENFKFLNQTIISPSAIEICARKVSIVNDLRRALEIIRESITLAEKEANLMKDGCNPLIKQQVEIRHVTLAMESLFSSSVRTRSRNAQIVGELNLHQKLLLATLHRLVQDSETLKPTVQTLFERYTGNVKLHCILDAVSRSEFNDLLVNTESMGVLKLVTLGRRSTNKSNNNSNGTMAISPDTRVLLAIPIQDVKAGLCDNPLFGQLL